MREPRATPVLASPGAAVLVCVALLFVALAQVIRVLFPRILILGEDTSYLLVGLLALGVFAAPLVALPLARPGVAGQTMVAGGLAILAARVLVQLIHPIPAWLAFAGPGTALAGMALVLVGLRARYAIDRWLAPAGVFGLTLDTALRAPWHTWDLIWQDGPASIVVTAAVLLAALAALWITARRPGRSELRDSAGGILSAFGPYLMLQLIFLQNPGYVGSQSGVGFAGAILTVMFADALAIAAAAVVIARPLGAAAAIVAAGLAGALGWLTVSTQGVGAIALVVGLQVVTTGCLALGLSPGRTRPVSERTLLGTTAAGLSFAILVLVWMIDIDRPLPFPREVVPAAAAGLVGLAAIVRTRSPRPVEAIAPGAVRGAGVATLALAILVPGFLWISRPTTDARPIPGPEVRIVSYNIRGAIGIDAMHRPDDIVREIASSGPDVVIIQEAARGWPVMGTADVLAYLQAGLDMPYRYQPSADRQFGNAILSRLPIQPISSGPLPPVPGSQGRSYLAVRVDVGETQLIVVGTHLETDSLEQIRAVLDAWGGSTPAVIAGDMNMQLDDEASVALFRNAGLVDASAATGDPCRTTSSQPTSDCDRPDWVWLTTDLQIRSFRIGTIDASDHLPIHVTVAFVE
ncbi:MAG: endonuclease/exonuclease/phosphatase family protein [Actinomycetota bacterium]